MRLGLWTLGVAIAVAAPLWASAAIGAHERRARQKTRKILGLADRLIEDEQAGSQVATDDGTAFASKEDRS